MADSDSADAVNLSRRGLLAGAGAAGAMGLAATALAYVSKGDKVGSDFRSRENVQSKGAHQAGIDRPQRPQQHCLVAIADANYKELPGTLQRLSQDIRSLTEAPQGEVARTPDGVGDLTISVGVGPGALLNSRFPESAALATIANFSSDAGLADDAKGGDLLLMVNSSDPSVLQPVMDRLLHGAAEVRVRWTELGYRGAALNGVPRNSLGYLDGIVGPSTAREMDENVWIQDGPLAGGTIAVIRKFALDSARFRALPQSEQDRIFGRRFKSGAPLSGGGRDSEVKLDAKRSDGELLIPESAHIRAAHPSFTGSKLMLRRSYSFRPPEADAGHLFISFQNDVETFNRTQLRMDEVDALRAFARPISSGAFAILPGDNGTALGSTIF